MSRTCGRAGSSSGGGGVYGRTGGGVKACGRADSCGRSGGRGAECSAKSCARPGAGDASQCAQPRDRLTDRPCFHDTF
jgi:hypothetical protein